MRLDFEQIHSALRGVSYVKEQDGKLTLHRFTPAQEELYRVEKELFYRRTFATAGVVLEFDTDSENLRLSVEVSPANGGNDFVHSIFADGRSVGELAGTMPPDRTHTPYQGSFPLGTGLKRVKIVFPWSAVSQIRAVEIDDGAQFMPVKKEKTMFLFGDSITQGFIAARPENTYASLTTEFLDVNGICKGIGGETFRPALAGLTDPVEPQLIIVAYGTNDWNYSKAEVFLENSGRFLRCLRDTYPDVPIVLLAPTWRADLHIKTDVGDFRSVADHYRSLAESTSNVTVIDCFDFVPHDSVYFHDQRVHPNDRGFRCYAQALFTELKNRI